MIIIGIYVYGLRCLVTVNDRGEEREEKIQRKAQKHAMNSALKTPNGSGTL